MIDSTTIKENVRELLTKKPFTRVLPKGSYEHGNVSGEVPEMVIPDDILFRKIITQEDFARELDPAGHIINDRSIYPDIWQQNEEDGRWYVQEIPRYAFAFQQIILVKHLTHLCGNNIRFELAEQKVNDEARHTYTAFRNGWAKKNMEVAWYLFAKSIKATGDGAFVGIMDKGHFQWKVLSFLNGDKLYPHYNLRTGKLDVLARAYNNYAENGTVTKRYIDVWDNTYYYRFVSNGDPTSFLEKAKRFLLKIFSADGYELEEMTPHFFNDIPVSYHRDDNGPCWTFSQESIQNYEHAFSNLAHSNHDFGLPIMYVKGEGSEEVTTNDMSYASKIMVLPEDGEIGFLNRQDASNAYKAELDKMEESIYKQSFAVKTPELKSGDTPGVALKIMYSDAFEKAMADAREYDSAVDKIVDIFSWGYGIEIEKRLDFMNTDISHYIDPYIHLNTTELTQNLNTAVLGGFLSKQTASEKLPYATPQEWDRILQEKHDDQMHQLLIEEQRIEIQNQGAVALQDQLSDIQAEQQIEVAKAQNDIQQQNGEEPKPRQSKKKVGSVATGRGKGRPNLSGKKWDENGNYEGRNGWDKWDREH